MRCIFFYCLISLLNIQNEVMASKFIGLLYEIRHHRKYETYSKTFRLTNNKDRTSFQNILFSGFRLK